MENQGFTGFIEDIDVSVIPDDPPGAKEFRESINIDPCVISNYPPHQAIDLIWESVSKLIGEGCSLDSFFGIEPADFQGYDVWPMYLKTVGMHTILNLLGYRSDKQLHKFRKTRASLSDASHIGFAIHSDYLITMDKAMGYKAEAIYSKLVVRFINSITYQVSSRSNFFQRNGTGVSLISAIPLSIRSFSSSLEVTRMWRKNERAIFEKAHSTRFNQEPCFGV